MRDLKIRDIAGYVGGFLCIVMVIVTVPIWFIPWFLSKMMSEDI